MNDQQPTIINDKVLVAGLGLTGLSCIRYLHKAGVELDVTDTRANPPKLSELQSRYPDVTWQPNVDSIEWDRISQVVVSPGLPVSSPLVQKAFERNIEVLGDVELFARAVKAPVIAITGSNGKSTVTTMLGDIARYAGINVQVGGNIGVPVLDLLDDEACELFVLELSSFQLETTSSLTPFSAVVLNLCADHLDRYRDTEHYLETKKKIFSNARSVLINLDDPRISELEASRPPSQSIVRFGLTKPMTEADYGLIEKGDETWLGRGSCAIINTTDLRVRGRHNWNNALAAMAMANLLQISDGLVAESLKRFRGLPHRTEWLATSNGVQWINDSKGTNVGATVSAIMGLPLATPDSRIILIAGGVSKDDDFSELRDALEGRVKLLLLLGIDAPKLAQQLERSVPIQMVENLEEAVAVANNIARNGDIVLLSPACASFDMFKNFEHRGDMFRHAVNGVVH